MLSTSYALSIPVLAGIAKNDALISKIPSLLLALVVLIEKCSYQSKWSPYLDILPKKYSTPLSFSFGEISLLKENVDAHRKIVRHFVNASLQYTYIHCLLLKLEKSGETFLHVKAFTWDTFVWAISVVLTRQNEIPIFPNQNEPGSKEEANRKQQVLFGKQAMELALIPVWDMCNHMPGEITSFFDRLTNCLECMCFEDVEENAQVYISYGPRSNLDLLIYSGFVLEVNSLDVSYLTFILSKDDAPSLLEIKEKILDTVNGGEKIGVYHIDASGTLPPDAIQFLRVAVLNDVEAKDEKRTTYSDIISLRNEVMMNKMICAAIQDKLNQFSTTYEEDGKLLCTPAKNQNAYTAILFRRSEKKVLIDAMNARENIAFQLHKKLQERQKKKKSQICIYFVSFFFNLFLALPSFLMPLNQGRRLISL